MHPSVAKRLLLHLHNLPNTLVGLALGSLGLPFGATALRGNGALQFLAHPFILPGYAMTLGAVVLYGRGARPESPTRTGTTLADHERQHIRQGEQLGILYLVSNLLGGLAAILRDGRWHGASNWNERGPGAVPPRPW